MYETREDAMSLARQQQRHETLIAELHRKRAWSLHQHHSEIIDLQHDIKELVSILRFADGDLYAIAKRCVAREGRRFHKERDGSAQRRNSPWDGIDRFRAQVRPLLRAPTVRTTTTTIRYKAKY